MLGDVQEQIEQNTDLDRFLDLDRQFHLGTYSGCHIDPLNAIVTRLWNSTSTTGGPTSLSAGSTGCGWSTPSTG